MAAPQQSESRSYPNFIEQLARTLGGEATAAHIFGAPVERDGVTVIPVAKARYGFGGGTKDGEAGGGGGAVINPAGYIEITDGGARFRPIRDLGALIPACAVGGLLTILTARGLAKLLRSSRTRLIHEE
jgi:uncharacterized spore protein YtfJ